jgi:hypothetical protein
MGDEKGRRRRRERRTRRKKRRGEGGTTMVQDTILNLKALKPTTLPKGRIPATHYPGSGTIFSLHVPQLCSCFLGYNLWQK